MVERSKPTDLPPAPDPNAEKHSLKEIEPYTESITTQIRLLMKPQFLDPTLKLNRFVTKEDLTDAQFNYRLSNNASFSERIKNKKELNTWITNTTATFKLLADTPYATHLTKMLGRFGVSDLRTLNSTQMKQLYERWCKHDTQINAVNLDGVLTHFHSSNTETFINDTLNAFAEDKEGNKVLNYDQLKAALPTIQWAAHIYGPETAELLTEQIHVLAKVHTNKLDQLVEEANKTKAGRAYTQVDDIEGDAKAQRLLEFLHTYGHYAEYIPPADDLAKEKPKVRTEEDILKDHQKNLKTMKEQTLFANKSFAEQMAQPLKEKGELHYEMDAYLASPLLQPMLSLLLKHSKNGKRVKDFNLLNPDFDIKGNEATFKSHIPMTWLGGFTPHWGTLYANVALENPKEDEGIKVKHALVMQAAGIPERNIKNAALKKAKKKPEGDDYLDTSYGGTLLKEPADKAQKMLADPKLDIDKLFLTALNQELKPFDVQASSATLRLKNGKVVIDVKK